MSRETELKNFFRKSKTRKRLGLKPGTSIGPAGASIVSDDGMRLKNTSGDPNKKLKTLEQLADSLTDPLPTAGVASAIRKAAQGKPKPMLEEEVDIPDVPVEKGKRPNMGQVAGGFKTTNVKKGGLMKAKKKKAKKSKVAGRLAKRGYGAARK